ncbi:MAG: GGDEF domain-containing protein [Xanthomonadaceae bacterium]|nr:GGDEF domain-containing protein [Xanthomonadaceae bacterium]
MSARVVVPLESTSNRLEEFPSAASVLDDAEYALFAQVAKVRQCKAGEMLFRRGEHGADMYVIASGTIELDFGDDLVRKPLGVGEFFGELGLLIGDHTRSANAMMTEAGVLLELGREEFDRLADRDPRQLAKFLRRAIMRVVCNEQALIGRLRRRNLELQNTLDMLRTTALQLDQSEILIRTDELTGLTNRRGFVAHVEQARLNGKLPGSVLILLDCDRFKAINDSHGHLAGDRVLQSVASLLRAVSGQDDIACRLGGDEFCLLIHGHSREEAARIAGYIVESARVLQRMHQRPPQMTTLSIGACTIEVAADCAWEHWYKQADTALYRAKRQGGDCIEWQD